MQKSLKIEQSKVFYNAVSTVMGTQKMIVRLLPAGVIP